jgi:hypothetical protein
MSALALDARCHTLSARGQAGRDESPDSTVTWSKSWRVLVTIIGWLAVIKGAVLMLFPRVMTLYVTFLSNTTLTLSGIYAIVLGGLFLFLGIKRK